MKTYMSTTEFDAYWTFLNRNLSFKQFRKFYTHFYQSTLPLLEKFKILRIVTKKECDADLAIEIFQTNFDTKRTKIRDQELLDFLAEKLLKENIELQKQQINIIT